MEQNRYSSTSPNTRPFSPRLDLEKMKSGSERDTKGNPSTMEFASPLGYALSWFVNLIRDVDIDPKTLITLVVIVDAADIALVTASYKAFETDFGYSPRQLGTLSAVQGLSFSLSLPFWGMFLPRYGSRYLLCLACFVWMITTLATPHASWFYLALVVRLFNGAALSGVMPISQAILADVVQEQNRGTAFGLLGSLHTLAKILVSYYVISMDRRWSECYYLVSIITLFLLVLIYVKLPASYGKTAIAESQSVGHFLADSWSTMKRIFTIPSFAILVAQGVAGGTPWQAMSFLNLYWVNRGFTAEQAARVSALTQCGAMVGCLLGGWLGDVFARRFRNHGRIMIAQISVLLGMPFWAMMLNSSFVDGSSMVVAVFIGFMFFLVATWCASGANRPICAELVTSPTERAQIVGLWVLVEGTFGSLFGAPVVGVVSELYGYNLSKAKITKTEVAEQDIQNANALGKALTGLGIICWSICFFLWGVMHFTFGVDKARAQLNDMDIEGGLPRYKKSDNALASVIGNVIDNSNLNQIDSKDPGLEAEATPLRSINGRLVRDPNVVLNFHARSPSPVQQGHEEQCDPSENVDLVSSNSSSNRAIDESRNLIMKT